MAVRDLLTGRRCGLFLLALACTGPAACTPSEPGSDPDALPSTATKFRLMPHEPSGAVTLGPGIVLIVEDEKEHPFDLLRFQPGMSVSDAGLMPATPLNDLEGATRDARGRLYAVTSHSPDRSGEAKQSRERLARFRIGEDGITDFEVLENLKPQLAHIPAFEIEGLAWDPVRQVLLLGLSGPLIDGQAVVVTLTNPDEAFAGAQPVLREAGLDLGGQGIRGIEHDDVLGGFVVIGATAEDPVRFDLWLWDGEATTAERLKVPALETLQRPEAVCQVEIGSSKRLLILSDDGTTDKSFYRQPDRPGARNTSTPGSFLLLDYEALRAPVD